MYTQEAHIFLKNKVDCSKIGNSWKKLSKVWTYTPKCANISHMCCEMLIQEDFMKKTTIWYQQA